MARSKPLGGAAWVGVATPSRFTVHLSAHNIPICDTGSLCAACLPGLVGGVANSAPQLLCLFLRGERLWDRGWSGTKSLCGP